MSGLYELVKKINDAYSTEEAASILYGRNGIDVNTKEYYQSIITNFIKKKEAIIKKENGCLIFDASNIDDMWNVVFLAEYIKENDLLLKQYNDLLDKVDEIKNELISIKAEHGLYRGKGYEAEHNEINNRYQVKNNELNYYLQLLEQLKDVRKTFYETQWVDLENISENANTSTSMEILRQAVLIVHKVRNAFEHDAIPEENNISINNGKFNISIPIEYFDGFNKGRIIADYGDQVVVERTNLIVSPLLEELGYDLNNIQSFFYNVDPSQLDYLLSKFSLDDIYKLPMWCFLSDSRNSIELICKENAYFDDLSLLKNMSGSLNYKRLKEVVDYLRKDKDYLSEEDFLILQSIRSLSSDFIIELLDFIENYENNELKECKCEFISLFNEAYYNMDDIRNHFKDHEFKKENMNFYKVLFSNASKSPRGSNLFDYKYKIAIPFDDNYHRFPRGYGRNNTYIKEKYDRILLILNSFGMSDMNSNTIGFLMDFAHVYENFEDGIFSIKEILTGLKNANVEITSDILCKINVFRYPEVKVKNNKIELSKFEGLLDNPSFEDIDKLSTLLGIKNYDEIINSFNIVKSVHNQITFKEFVRIFTNVHAPLIIDLLDSDLSMTDLFKVADLGSYDEVEKFKYLYSIGYSVEKIFEILKNCCSCSLSTFKTLFPEGKELSEYDYKFAYFDYEFLPSKENGRNVNSDVTVDFKNIFDNEFESFEITDDVKSDLLGMYIYMRLERGFVSNFFEIAKEKISSGTYNKKEMIKNVFDGVFRRFPSDDYPFSLMEYVIENDIERDYFIDKYYSDIEIEKVKEHTNDVDELYKFLQEKVFLNGRVSQYNLVELLKYVDGDVKKLYQFPLEIFSCSPDVLDNMIYMYNGNVCKSIFGIDNPKIIGTLIYCNSVFSKYQKENGHAQLVSIDTNRFMNTCYAVSEEYKNNISDINVDNNTFMRQFVYDDEHGTVRDDDQVKAFILDKLRNASAHFRFKPVVDNDGNIVEDKIYLYDKYDESNKNNFNIIIDLKDLVEVTRRVELGIGPREDSDTYNVGSSK